MPKPLNPIVPEVVAILESKGRPLHLTEIFHQIRARGKIRWKHLKNFEASVRDAIETRSSNSNRYRGKIKLHPKKDLFFKANDVRDGIWGLRSDEDFIEDSE